MKNFYSFITLLLTVLLGAYCHGQTVILNEVMASNATTIADEDGDYEDWIELYNYGDESIHLAGFGLSDDYDEPFRWYFPDVVLAPGEFLLVWASGKNRRNPARELHTGFSISSAGEEVLLTAPDGTRLDELAPVELPTDVSAGRKPGDLQSWYFFDEPTPGFANTSTAWAGVLPPPVVSHPGGFYEHPFQLTITSDIPGVSLYYTLDGSVPDPANLNGSVFQYKNNYPENPGDPFGPFLERSFRSFIYENPFWITDQTGYPDQISQINTSFTTHPPAPHEEVLHGTVVRAVATKEGYLPSRIISNTYIVQEGIQNRFQLPVVSVVMPDTSLFDYNTGIYVAGKRFDDWRSNNPGREIWPGAPGNWEYSGVEWERAMHLELFDNQGGTELSQNFGFRIHGGWSCSNHKKSFRIYARNIYDVANEIDYVFFPDDGRPLDGKPTGTFKRVLFRAGGNDSDMIRDAAAQALMKHTSVGTQRTTPVIHFINGAYWGLANIRDRQDRYHIAFNYDLDPENVIIIDSPWTNVDAEQLEEGIPSDINLFNDFFSFVTGKNMADPQHYRELRELIDIDSYIDYYVMFIYLTANDWGGHENPGTKHFRFWRARETSPKAYNDGKWRVMVWDFDGGFANFNQPLLTTVMDPDNKPSRLLLNMMEQEHFKNRFINRFADLLNTHFLPEHVLGTIHNKYEAIQSEIAHDEARWDRSPVPSYHHLQSYAIHRPSRIRNEIMDVFGLTGHSDITLKTDTTMGHIRINTIDIVSSTPGVHDAGDWTGLYFHGLPVELEAVPAPGMIFSHWEGLPEGTPGRTSIFLEDDITLTAHFKNEVIHYWHFNELPDADYFTGVLADFSVFPGEAEITYPGSGPGYMDRTDGTTLNAHLDAPAGYGLRVRNPSNT
ncbi:MAG: CotH kinase family protein, partial [Bacteroidales bacterium]|nr:CotH kinase family protein [Bacteroidales bacterium]